MLQLLRFEPANPCLKRHPLLRLSHSDWLYAICTIQCRLIMCYLTQFSWAWTGPFFDEIFVYLFSLQWLILSLSLGAQLTQSTKANKTYSYQQKKWRRIGQMNSTTLIRPDLTSSVVWPNFSPTAKVDKKCVSDFSSIRGQQIPLNSFSFWKADEQFLELLFYYLPAIYYRILMELENSFLPSFSTCRDVSQYLSCSFYHAAEFLSVD